MMHIFPPFRFLEFVDEWKENGNIWVEVYKQTSIPCNIFFVILLA